MGKHTFWLREFFFYLPGKAKLQYLRRHEIIDEPLLVWSKQESSDSDHCEQGKPVKFEFFADYMSIGVKQNSVG